MFLPAIKELILQRDEDKCIYCGKETNGIDHVIPYSEGGHSISANGVCCCKSCNSSKSTSLDEKWVIKGLQRLILHGEDLDWLVGVRPDYPLSDRQVEAKTILTEVGFGASEIDEIIL